jgi:hypothetical protein
MVLFKRMMWDHRRWLLNSPAKPNESVILELSSDWAPSNNSWSSPIGEGKVAYYFVSYWDKN